MRFVPKKEFNILTEEEFSSEIKNIEQKLEACMCSGFFDSFDGKKLYYEYFLAEDAKASIVIVHGLSEFTKKYYEVSFYLLNMGFNVFIFDQRCHGHSCRLTKDRARLHVNKFDDYVADLSLFIDNVVLKTEDKPIYIYSHSMGGAVSALYLSKNSSKIEKAVFSAPMFEPVVKIVPMPIARIGVGIGRFFCGGKTKFPISKEFNPAVKRNEKVDQSQARFEHHISLRRSDPDYQTTPMSFGWTHGSLTVRRKIMKKKVLSGIATPILLISAENDKAVNNIAHEEFVSKCRVCKRIIIKGATHSMLNGNPEVLSEHIGSVMNFFG